MSTDSDSANKTTDLVRLPSHITEVEIFRAEKNWRFTCLAWSPDGRWLAVGQILQDPFKMVGRVSVREMTTGRWLTVISPTSGLFPPITLAWHPDGRRIASGGAGDQIAMLELLPTHLHVKWVTNARGRLPEHVVIGSSTVTKNRRFLDIAPQISSKVYCLAWSPDGRQLAVAGDFPSVVLLDEGSGGYRESVSVAGAPNFALAWPSKDRLVVGDTTISLSTRKAEREFHGHRHHVSHVIVSGNETKILAASLDGTIRQWDYQTGVPLAVMEGLSQRVKSLSLASQYPLLAAQGHLGTLWLVHSEALEQLAQLPFRSECNRDTVAFHPAGTRLAVIRDWNRSISLLEVDAEGILGLKPVRKNVRYTNAKVVLVGDTGVGKSGMALRLRGKQWRETDSTHGRKVHLLDSTVDESDPHGPIRRDVLLWDLAGQSDYRLTHQLHLDMVTVALVLFDGRDPKNPLGAPEYWSHALSLARGQDRVVKILVAAREDRTGVGLPERVLEEFCKRHGFAKFFRTSAKRNINIAELRKFALEQIDWGKLPVITSTGWLEAVRKQVERCQRAKEAGMIQTVGTLFEKLNEGRAEKCPLGEFISCLERLDQADVVRLLTFERAGAPPQESTPVLLEPEFVDAYASAIVNAAKNDPGGIGSLPEAEVLAGQFVMDEDERLADKAEEKELLHYVVGFLLDHELALRDEERPGDPEARGVNYLVFPSLYTAEMPFPDRIKQAVWWHFTGAVRNLFTVLLARLARHREFTRPEYWRDAARFAHAQGGRVIVLLKEKGTGTAELALAFEGEVKKPVQEALGRFVEEMFWEPRFRSNTRKWQTQHCNTCGQEMDREAAVTRYLRGEKDIICAACGNRQPFWLLPETVTKAGELELVRLREDAEIGAQRDVAATVVAGLQAEGKHDLFISYNSADREQVLRLAESLKNLGLRPWLDVWEIVPGQRWQPQLQKAVKKIKRSVVCIGASGKGPWQDVEMDALLKQAVKRKDFVIPVALPGAPEKLKLDPFWEQLQSVNLREWEAGGSAGLKTLVGALFGEAPGRMRDVQLDARWVAEQRSLAPRPRAKTAESSQVVLTLHTTLSEEKEEALQAVRAQIAERLNIPAETVRIAKVGKGSIKITLEFDDATDATRLLAQVQAGNRNILELFERWSAKSEEFIQENKGIQIPEPPKPSPTAIVAGNVMQTPEVTREEAARALARIGAVLEQHVDKYTDLAETRKLLGGAQAELDEEEPDTGKIAKRTGRVLEALKGADPKAEWFKEIVNCGMVVAEFCGTQGTPIMQALETIAG